MTKLFFYFDGESLGTKEKVIAVAVGDKGYYPITSKLSAEELNKIAGIPFEIAESAVAGSMFGWDAPTAARAVAFAKEREASLS